MRVSEKCIEIPKLGIRKHYVWIAKLYSGVINHRPERLSITLTAEGDGGDATSWRLTPMAPARYTNF